MTLTKVLKMLYLSQITPQEAEQMIIKMYEWSDKKGKPAQPRPALCIICGENH